MAWAAWGADYPLRQPIPSLRQPIPFGITLMV
jgi:hypothetical protein